MNALFVGVAIGGFIATLVAYVIGVVMARRAWKRHGWLEMRLVYRGFVVSLLLPVIANLIMAGFGFLADGRFDVSEWFRVLGAIFAIAGGAAMVAVSVGLYRLARRGAL